MGTRGSAQEPPAHGHGACRDSPSTLNPPRCRHKHSASPQHHWAVPKSTPRGQHPEGTHPGGHGDKLSLPKPCKARGPVPHPKSWCAPRPPRACPTGDPGPHPGQTLSHGQGPAPPHSHPHPRTLGQPPVPARSPWGAGGRGAARGGGREKAESTERGFIESKTDPARFKSD